MSGDEIYWLQFIYVEGNFDSSYFYGNSIIFNDYNHFGGLFYKLKESPTITLPYACIFTFLLTGTDTSY